MGIRGYDWQTIQIPFSTGIETKLDVRFSSPPSLDIARDVWFESIGGLQTRLPFAAMNNNIFGGGTLSNCRYLAVVNGELCVFTDVAFYSWNAQQNAWVLRGTHLAPSISETNRFVTTGDQIDGDRAELNGTVVFAWSDGGQAYAAAFDKTTGSVLVSPTAVGTSVGKPRLVALTTKILLFTDAGGNSLVARSIDPASPGTAILGVATSILSVNYNGLYDAVRVPGADTAIVVVRRTPTTSYSIFKVTAALAITSATPGRSCDGPIAVSIDPNGTNAQVARVNGANVQGDLVSVSALADVFTNQAIGTTPFFGVSTIAACHRSVQNSGQFRCYVFWGGTDSAAAVTKFNWVDTGGGLGTQASFIQILEPASRAFDYNGSVYVWMVFGAAVSSSGLIGGSLQNTYFLYRDDQLLCAKSASDVAGGYPPSQMLPNVQAISAGSYAWCGAVRRSIALANSGTSYGARSPHEIVTTFDSNQARRNTQLGQTLYIAGGEVMQYDGVRLVEAGFHIWPYTLSPANAAGGSMATGTYAYKATWRYVNARGEMERSTTAVIPTVTVSGSAVTCTSTSALNVTHKTSVPPAVEFWRTTVSPAVDSPFYLVSSQDPTALTNPNRYLPNDQTSASLATFNDALADSSILGNEANPENGTILETLAPPAASLIFATDTRLFIGGVPGDPDRIWYSRERNDGEIASFNDALTIDVPPQGGAITSIWFQDGVLYVGRQYAIYALPGVGFDNFGQGQNFGPARIVSLDVGPVSQEAQCLTPIGTVFKSAKGWQLLERSGTVRYIGGAASAFDSDTVLAMHTVASRHQLRILTNNRMLMWDFRGAIDAASQDPLGNWAEWTISDGLHAVMWQGTYVYLTATGPKAEQAAYSGLTYGMDAETSWIKLHDLQGFGKVGALELLGEYRGAGLARIRVARDYQYDGAGNVVYYDDKAWLPSPATIGSALQVRHSPSASNGNCEAIKVRITAVTESARATLLTASALSPAVATSGTNWTSTWSAANSTAPNLFPGEMGNRVSMAISFETGATLVDVRDHFTYNASLGRWTESQNRIGVRVVCQAGALTVAALETAIAAGTKLATLSAADATPSKTINIATMSGQVATGSFSGGAYGAPAGEVFRLTGLGLEVGLDPRLYKRLPAAQKQ